MSGIDRAAWLKAVGESQVQQNVPGALTMLELAEIFQVGRSAAEVRVRKLVARGAARMVQLKRQDSSGKWRIYNAFVLTKGDANAGRRSRRR